MVTTPAVSAAPDPAFWRGRRVLLTGHTGFKGAWLALWLADMGARVTAIALPASSRPNLSQLLEIAESCDCRTLDIRDAAAMRELTRAVDPEVVVHMAAQSLVRASYREPLETCATNAMGTANLLDALRLAPSVRAVVAVTTDKVYRNREWVWPYREEDALGGFDPYSASKAAAELLVESWRLAFLEPQGVGVATARAGNVIGGGDWSEDRLIPDAIRAWSAGEELLIRRPDAIRPWQHVLDPLAAYLVLAERLYADGRHARAWNFGPPGNQAATVRDVIDLAKHCHPGAAVRFSAETEGPHEAGWLALDTSAADRLLGIRSRFSLEESVRRSIAWYVALQQGVSARALCRADIAAWEQAG